MKTKVWLISGCSTGLGHSIAEHALEMGYKVAVTARKTEDLMDLVSKYPETSIAIKLDVTKPEDITSAIPKVVQRFGTIDVLVNNAGIGYFAAIEESEDEAIRRMFEVNFFGLANLTKAVLPLFRRKRAGHIINIASVGGLIAYPSLGFYHATKFAVDGYSEALSKEVGPLGIKVTLIEPSAFRTEWAGSNANTSSIIIPDYAQTAGAAKQAYINSYGKQAGDPKRAAEAIATIVETDNPPLRLLLGVEALEEARKKVRELQKDFDAWEETTVNADFPQRKLQFL